MSSSMGRDVCSAVFTPAHGHMFFSVQQGHDHGENRRAKKRRQAMARLPFPCVCEVPFVGVLARTFLQVLSANGFFVSLSKTRVSLRRNDERAVVTHVSGHISGAGHTMPVLNLLRLMHEPFQVIFQVKSPQDGCYRIESYMWGNVSGSFQVRFRFVSGRSLLEVGCPIVSCLREYVGSRSYSRRYDIRQLTRLLALCSSACLSHEHRERTMKKATGK